MKAITADQPELIEAILAELDIGLLTARFGQQFPPFAVATKDALKSALAQAEQDAAMRQMRQELFISSTEDT